ncbi:MAG: cytochrome C [Xanthomonadaceae bacterium]|nr:cytochrome C [Xanthomonadaceae bacterium]
MKKKQMIILAFAAFIWIGIGQAMAANPPMKMMESGCMTSKCHAGLADIRSMVSPMQAQIVSIGKMHGDPSGCTVCHGGNPAETVDKKKAHMGAPKGIIADTYYPDPGSLWIAEKTCGQCHLGYVYNLERALMNTEAGKIQGNVHTFGFEEVQGQKVPWGNYDVSGTKLQVGTAAYQKYISALANDNPNQFPRKLDALPDPTIEQIKKDPKLAGITYARSDCQRCHVGVRGRQKRGDYRGMGCSACHILYGNEGYYQGNDKSIKKDERGHMMKHRIQGTRKAGKGIPVEICNSCHNRGKRIGVSYQGLMEFPYGTPFSDKGKMQPKLHTKKYLFISDDLHHQYYQSRKGNPKGGMLCQDCHTTIDMHGDGLIHGTTLGQVEIECQDCHGTTDKYPWELPLGFSEEFGRKLSEKGRGLSPEALPNTIAFGTLYPAMDGYLLSTRGNPLGNVVKNGTKVTLHSASGNDFDVPVLKQLKTENKWVNAQADVAMDKVKKHNEKLECYTCHSSWAPQCYGCHVKIDYRAKNDMGKNNTHVDWVKSGQTRTPDGQTAESNLKTKGIVRPGKPYEGRSYLRWEDPILGYNGENRVSPLMPGCQIVYTVIGPDGEMLASNEIAKAKDEQMQRGQKESINSLDMSPVQPHTSQRQSRTCESCHNNPKALGLGIGGGVFQTKYPMDIVEDLLDQRDGSVIPEKYQVQVPKIKDLKYDWSTIVTPEGVQVQKVGSHWPLSRPFTLEEMRRIDRSKLCMGCHRDMTNKKIWDSVNTKDQIDVKQHIEKMNQLMRGAIEAGKGKQPLPKAEK